MATRPILVGVTGGIGAGKSTVCQILQTLGYPIYDADSRAKVLMSSDTKLKGEIIAAFGEESFDGEHLNRDHLAKAFIDPKALNQLNNLVHPAVARDFSKWVSSQSARMVIKEAALLFEAGSYRDLDHVLLVRAPMELRVRRILSRDPFRTSEEVHQIIGKQWPDEEKAKLADQVVDNDEQELLIPQVLNAVKQLQL